MNGKYSFTDHPPLQQTYFWLFLWHQWACAVFNHEKSSVTLGLPGADPPLPVGWAALAVLTIVLLILGWSASTWSGVVPEMFFMVSVFVLGSWKSGLWFLFKASVVVRETLDVIAVMLLLAAAWVRLWFRLIPGVSLQVVLAWDRPRSILGIVFRKVSVFLGSCSRTSGVL